MVRAAQHRTTAAELGILPSDNLSDLASVPTRIAFLNQLADRVRLLQHVFRSVGHLQSARSSRIMHGAALSMRHMGVAADVLHLQQVRAANVTRLAVVTTWGGGMASVRRDLLPWMQIMTELGVSSFYVRLVFRSSAGCCSHYCRLMLTVDNGILAMSVTICSVSEHTVYSVPHRTDC